MTERVTGNAFSVSFYPGGLRSLPPKFENKKLMTNGDREQQKTQLINTIFERRQNTL